MFDSYSLKKGLENKVPENFWKLRYKILLCFGGKFYIGWDMCEFIDD